MHPYEIEFESESQPDTELDASYEIEFESESQPDTELDASYEIEFESESQPDTEVDASYEIGSESDEDGMEEHLEISKPFEFDMVLVSWDKHVTKFHAFGAIFVTMQCDAGHKNVWNSLEHNSKRNKKEYDDNVAIAASILLSGGTFMSK